MITVEACGKCGGWHPGKDRCPPRKRIDTGLRTCRHCGGFHFGRNADVCMTHAHCKCAKHSQRGN